MIPRGTALFIEPHGTLLEALRERKAWLEQAMPGQAFCNHPPHCTLLFGSYGAPAEWLETLRENLSAQAAFELEINNWQQFPHDALAGGGHTVAYRAHLTPALAHLQQTVADSLAPFVSVGPNIHPLANTKPFASSLRKYGFPFVGAHWIPHFTIGSPLIPPTDPLLAHLVSGSTRHRFIVQTVSVWRVVGDTHERLHELALADTQS